MLASIGATIAGWIIKPTLNFILSKIGEWLALRGRITKNNKQINDAVESVESAKTKPIEDKWDAIRKVAAADR